MRLIDADFVLSQLTIDSYMVKDEKYLMAMHRAKEVIKNAPDAVKPMEWISVDYALPKPGDKVLFVNEWNETYIGEVYYTEDFSENDGTVKKNIPVFQDCDYTPYFISEGHIKCWMPLPELPGECNG
jgi:hypothetical protein